MNKHNPSIKPVGTSLLAMARVLFALGIIRKTVTLTSPISRVAHTVSILDFRIIKQYGRDRILQEYYTRQLLYMVCYFSEKIKYFFLLTLKLQNMQVFVKYSILIGTVIYTYQAGKTCKAPVTAEKSEWLRKLRFVYSGEQCWHTIVLNYELDSAEVCMHFFCIKKSLYGLGSLYVRPGHKTCNASNG